MSSDLKKYLFSESLRNTVVFIFFKKLVKNTAGESLNTSGTVEMPGDAWWAIKPWNDYISIIFHEEAEHKAVVVSDFRFSLFWDKPSSRRVVKYVSFFFFLLFFFLFCSDDHYLFFDSDFLIVLRQLQDGEPLCMLTQYTLGSGENIPIYVADLRDFDFFVKTPAVQAGYIFRGNSVYAWFQACCDVDEAMNQDPSMGLPEEDDITRDIKAQVSFCIFCSHFMNFLYF